MSAPKIYDIQNKEIMRSQTAEWQRTQKRKIKFPEDANLINEEVHF